MKHFLARKLFNKSFPGTIVILTAITVTFQSCQKENINNTLQPELAKNAPELKQPNRINIDDPDKRTIYLTFDDGPNRGTENMIKILNKHNIYASSFVVGNHINSSNKQKLDYADLQQDSLIEIANHSYSHANNKYAKFYQNPDKVVHDFKIVRDSLKLLNPIARTPGRNIWRINGINITDIKASKIAADQLQTAGFKLIGWDLEWHGSPQMKLKNNHQDMLKKVDSIFFNDLEKTPRHLVLLTHDQYLHDENSVKELDLFIQKLKESNRFVFKKISDYPKINETLN